MIFLLYMLYQLKVCLLITDLSLSLISGSICQTGLQAGSLYISQLLGVISCLVICSHTVSQTTHLSVCLSVCLSVSQSVSQSVCLAKLLVSPTIKTLRVS